MSLGIGIVASGARATRFKMFSQSPIEGTYVEVDMTDGTTLCGEIVDQESISPYLENADLMRHSPERVANVGATSVWVCTVQTVALLGKDGPVRPRVPPRPGSAVNMARAENVARMLNIPKGGFRIGQLQDAGLEFRVAREALSAGHMAILGRTGSGKSHLVNLLARQGKRGGLNCLIFAFAREYEQSGLRYLEPKDLILPNDERTIEMLVTGNVAARRSSFGKGQQGRSSQAELFGRRITKESRERSLAGSEIAEHIGDGDVSEAIAVLPFKFGPRSEVQSIWNEPSVVDLAGVSIEIAIRVVAVIMGELMRAALSGAFAKQPLIVFLEEAHNLAPSVGGSASKNILARAAREGRKHGLAVGLVSQRPRFIDPTILSQCLNFFYFQLPYPEDSTYALQFTPYYSEQLVGRVRGLERGQCLVFGSVTPIPICVAVDSK